MNHKEDHFCSEFIHHFPTGIKPDHGSQEKHGSHMDNGVIGKMQYILFKQSHGHGPGTCGKH